ncbi:MAG TPA: glycosyltransferase family 39 protein [Humisphaera sp.]
MPDVPPAPAAVTTDVAPLPLAWATWPRAVTLIVAVLAARVAYLVWLSPYELLGDEAYYWEWSRHLDLCYYEKGPGLAYLIAASTRLFGDAEWSVRLPAAVSIAVAAWACGRLAIATAGGDGRAGFVAVAVFLLLPAFQANAQICTQDAPVTALWLLATLAGLRLVRRWRRGRTSVADWLLLSGAVGVGFLFKQSALLFGLGAAAYWVLCRRQLRWHRGLAWSLLAAAALLAALASPVVVWNAQHGWPTLAHTAGHAGMGGDKGGGGGRYDWMALPRLVGAQVGAFGPPAIALLAAACAWAVRRRRAEPGPWVDHLFLMCSSIPAIGFFVAISLATPVLGSWPFPSYGPLVALLGVFAATAASAGGRVQTGTSDAAGGPLPVRPKLPWVWKALGVYGAVACLLLSFPTLLGHVPLLDRTARGPLRRIAGQRQRAVELANVAAGVRSPDGRPPVVVARYYMTAAQHAFYMPGHPTVACAGTQLGKRPSSYDYWHELDLRGPALIGGTMVLDGQGEYPWPTVLNFESVRPLAGGRAYVGVGYNGVSTARRHSHPARRATEPGE